MQNHRFWQNDRGLPFSRGALFHLLKNRLYLGKITHKDTIHERAHDRIVDLDVFEAVQHHIARNTRRHHDAGVQRVAKAMLTVRIFAAPRRSTPTHVRSPAARGQKQIPIAN